MCIKNLDLESDPNMNFQSKEIIGHLSSTSKLQGKHKRHAWNQNLHHIFDGLRRSIFNESPATKRVKYPIFNSLASTSHQSPTETYAPSPLLISQQFKSNLVNMSRIEVNGLPPIFLELQLSNDSMDTFVNVDIVDNTCINNSDFNNQPIQCKFTIPLTLHLYHM